ncbi:30S ribosomal protein S1 [Candidatus Calescamantes bacterium]|nr:30S ribosomal protein S1 [Candidatus Calescamantes bacterium]
MLKFLFKSEVNVELVKEEKVENWEELLEKSIPKITEGQVIKGRVVQILDNEVLVEIGYKSEGVLPLSDFEKPEEVKVGDEVDVLIESREDIEGMVVLSLEKADILKHWERLREAYRAGEPVKGKIMKRIKGGYVVDVGLPAFLPSSQLALDELKDRENVIGQELNFKILKLTQWKRNVVVSHKAYVEEERERRKQELLSTLEKGNLVKGRVKNITDFGAFIDLGGLDGLLHISDISWGRLSHPSEVLKVGQEIEVVVLDVDREKERISLGLKQKTPDPWESVEEKYPPGKKVRGKVVNITHYGVFVELEEGVEGLVHISELSWRRKVTHPSQVVGMGEMVEAVVLSVDKENKKMALSIKQVEPDPWSQAKEKYTVGSVVIGKVKNVTERGVYVEVEDGVEGLIPLYEIAWTQGPIDPAKYVKKGENVKTIVTDIDEDNRRFILSRRKLLPDPWESVGKKYKVGMEIEGRVTKVTDFGAFVEVEEGVEGLLHVSQIGDGKIKNPREILSVGDRIKVKIIRLSPEARRMGLSMRGDRKGVE